MSSINIHGQLFLFLLFYQNTQSFTKLSCITIESIIQQNDMHTSKALSFMKFSSDELKGYV